MTMHRPRFDLLSLLEAVTAVAFVAALLASSGGMGQWTFHFGQLPPDDSALRAWLDEQGFENVAIARDAATIALTWRLGVLASIRNDIFPIPEVPWEEFGYSELISLRGSTSWSSFGGTASLWLTGLGLLLIFTWVRKRPRSRDIDPEPLSEETTQPFN